MNERTTDTSASTSSPLERAAILRGWLVMYRDYEPWRAYRRDLVTNQGRSDGATRVPLEWAEVEAISLRLEAA